jgi:ribosome-binding protein aMBF1 (putative translation factor)
MTTATQSLSASSGPTKGFERIFGDAGQATSCNACQVYSIEDFAPAPAEAPPRHSTIDALVSEWEQDEGGRAALVEGRKWVADAFFAEEGDTVRSLRLRKGWSQTRLAEELATSQSHVARIERGTENLTIETCRKLARALEIDLNTLDQALVRQEAIARAKQQ